uniref:Uncharacterized protein n=1 Tax=Aegilops tauschii TaxID=37682 RepID=R7VYX9_AEGTA
MEDVPLPPASISFDLPSGPPGQYCSRDFMAFGSNRDKILAVDSTGGTYLYDAAVHGIRFSTNMPMMLQRVMKPMSAAVGDHCLFVMSGNGIDHQFAALMNGRNHNDCNWQPNWHWQSLRPPPFPAASSNNRTPLKSAISSGCPPWEPARSASTQRAARGERSARAGGRPRVATAWWQPLARTPAWQNLGSDLGSRFWPKDWRLMSTDLLPLGSGRLCTARFFLTKDEDRMSDYHK